MKSGAANHINMLGDAVRRLNVWSGLLDAINVFPVADGDTGANLIHSLSPLLVEDERGDIADRLLLSSRGNSGNIAGCFLSAYLSALDDKPLAEATRRGRDRAYQATREPKPGTMLSFLDALADGLEGLPRTPVEIRALLDRLVGVVLHTREQLPVLRETGVVDAGALGLHILFDAYFRAWFGIAGPELDVASTFAGAIRLAEDFKPASLNEYCVDAVVRVSASGRQDLAQLLQTNSSVVAYELGDLVKLHLHAADEREARDALQGLGAVEEYYQDYMADQVNDFSPQRHRADLHVMTDAAGSLTRRQAARFSMTLLDSYVHVGGACLPETTLDPARLYEAMAAGRIVRTSQASARERELQYAKALSLFDRVTYLCVGSVYTGNYEVAAAWKAANDPEDRFTVIDTGVASGKLGLLAYVAGLLIAVQRCTPATLHRFLAATLDEVQELVFLDRLEYLARGGRISKTSAFFGDKLRMKPVISPTPTGPRKEGVVRDRKAQLRMAYKRLAESLPREGVQSFIMVQYSDNEPFVRGALAPSLRELYPAAQVIVQPLSLTSGVHMGPGTWGVAWLTLPRGLEGVADDGC